MARDAAGPKKPLPPAGPPADGGADPRDRGQPLYLTISETLQKDISAGKVPVNAMLPTETELCRRFGVSRYTVREALRRLTDLGLVSRRAGSGSVVLATQPPTAFVHRVESLTGLLRYPSSTHRQRLSAGTIRADREIAELVDCEIGKEWFRLSALRRTDEGHKPICSVDFYIQPELAIGPDFPEIDKLSVPVRIGQQHGIEVQRTGIRIFASAIRPPRSAVLEVEPGTPALTMVRAYFDEKSWNFVTTVSIHPEHRFVYSMDLTRES